MYITPIKINNKLIPTSYYSKQKVNSQTQPSFKASVANVNGLKKISRLDGFKHIKDRIENIRKLSENAQRFLSSVTEDGRECGFVLLRYILDDAEEKDLDIIFNVLNDYLDIEKLNFDNDYEFYNYSQSDIFKPDLIKYSLDNSKKINPTNLRKLLEFRNNKDEKMFDAAECLKDINGVIRNENINAYKKMSEYVFDEQANIYTYNTRKDFRILNKYIKNMKDANGIIKPEFIDKFTEICKKYAISSNNHTMKDLIEIMRLIENDKPTNLDAAETLYRYGINNKMNWEMDRFDMIIEAVNYMWDKKNNEINPEKLDMFKICGGLTENKSKTIEEIENDIDDMLNLRNNVKIEDYNNLYIADNMLEILRDLKEEGKLHANILTIPIKENDAPLLMYIADILPTEENKKRYDKILKILKEIDGINYNYKDEMGVSFLEKVMMSENSKLLELIKDKPLEYYPELEYAYKNIENPEFKKGVNELHFRLSDSDKEIGKSDKIEEKAKSIEEEKPLLSAILQKGKKTQENPQDGNGIQLTYTLKSRKRRY